MSNEIETNLDESSVTANASFLAIPRKNWRMTAVFLGGVQDLGGPTPQNSKL